MDKMYEAPEVVDYGRVDDFVLVGPGTEEVWGPITSLIVTTHGGPYTQSLSNITE